MSSEVEKAEAIEVEQLRVGKHFRMKSPAGSLSIHASEKMVGVWVHSDACTASSGTIGLVAESGKMPYICVWPEKGYAKGGVNGGNKLPFALSAAGLQIPHRDGTVTTLSLEEVSDLVRNLKK